MLARMDEGVHRVANFLSVVEEGDVRIGLSGEATVQGDRMLVQRAITSLLTSAVRHSDFIFNSRHRFRHVQQVG